MRPLVVLHVFSGDLWAGAEVVIASLLGRLIRDPGLQIIALGLNDGELTQRLRGLGVETHVVPESRHSLGGIVWQAIGALRGRALDVVHSHRYKENLLGLVLSKRAGARGLVATVHGLPESGDREKPRAPLGWKSRLDYLILRRCFGRTVAVSDDMRRTLIERRGFASSRVETIHNGTAFAPSAPAAVSKRNGTTHVGTVARMVPVKDLDLFLRVGASLRETTRDLRLSVLGDGPLRPALEQRVRDLCIADCTTFVPPSTDPAPYYASLDIYLNTSWHEGLPMSVLEAMASARAIVAARVGGIPEIIEDGEDGLLVEGRDPPEFARRCLELIGSADLRSTIGRNAVRTVTARFSAQHMAEKYARLYRRLCGEARS
jgi:glycosyltransferase involved in cell wall biosynthesis